VATFYVKSPDPEVSLELVSTYDHLGRELGYENLGDGTGSLTSNALTEGSLRLIAESAGLIGNELSLVGLMTSTSLQTSTSLMTQG